MADVKEHLDRLQHQVDLLHVTAKLMSSVQLAGNIGTAKQIELLMGILSDTLHSIGKHIDEDLRDLDLAISIKGHKDK